MPVIKANREDTDDDSAESTMERYQSHVVYGELITFYSYKAFSLLVRYDKNDDTDVWNYTRFVFTFPHSLCLYMSQTHFSLPVRSEKVEDIPPLSK